MYIPEEGVDSKVLCGLRNKEYERLVAQVALGKAQVGPDAARRIARRIERQHGFWDHPQRKASA